MNEILRPLPNPLSGGEIEPPATVPPAAERRADSFNPYLGPKAFEERDSAYFFGRDEESRQLTSLVIAHRVVLFYAQSGAGKTSLLKASVIPELKRRKKVEVLPLARVTGHLPTGVGAGQVSNIYVFNALASLAGSGAVLDKLAGLSLLQGLQPFLQPEGGDARPRPRLLILDQFEELFTSHPERQAERAGFFHQLQECLDAYPQLSLLLSMREDYIARLDFYAAQMHDRLRTRFRMERLTYESALQAVQEPAALAKRPFDPGVAEELVDNLRRVQIGGFEGESSAKQFDLGDYVEPVHLQIVCWQLWNDLSPGGASIRAEDVQEFGDVDEALAGFYERAVALVLHDTSIGERRLRSWFDEELITPAHTRGLVYRGKEDTAGLPNAAVKILSDAYVIRGDVRGTDTWYELAHDRLVEPIMATNRAWRDSHQSPLAAAAEAWRASGEQPDRLYHGDQLHAARKQVEAQPEEFSPLEREFIRRSQDAARQQTSRRQRLMLAGAFALLVLVSGLAVWAFVNAARARTAEGQAKAERERAAAAERIALQSLSGSLIAQAMNTGDRTLALLLGVEAVQVTQAASAGDTYNPSALRGLFDLAAGSGMVLNPTLDAAKMGAPLASESGTSRLLHLQSTGSAQAPAASPQPWDELRLAPSPQFIAPSEDTLLAVDDQAAYTWSWKDGSATLEKVVPLGQQWIASLDLSSDGQLLATASSDSSGQRGSTISIVRLWNLGTGNDQPLEGNRFDGGTSLVKISPDGHWLVSGGEGGVLRVWSLLDRSLPPRVLQRHRATISALAFSRDSDFLFSGSADGVVLRWELGRETPDGVSLGPQAHSGAVLAIAVSPDGRWLATGSEDRTVRLWDRNSGEVSVLLGHEEPVNVLAISPDGKWLVSADIDGQARLWDLRAERPDASSQALSPMSEAIRSAAFDRSGRWLFLLGLSTYITRTDLSTPYPADTTISILLPPSATTMTISPDGRWLFTGSDAGVTIYDLDLASLIKRACSEAGRNLTAEEWDQYLPGQAYHKTCKDLPAHDTVVESFLEKARERARLGEVNEAKEWIERVAALDPQRAVNAPTEIVKALTAQSRALARQGDLEGARARYAKARQQDSSLALDDKDLENSAKAQRLVDQSTQLLREDKLEEARELQRQAMALDSALNLDPDALGLGLASGAPLPNRSPYLYGLHDAGGESVMLDAGKPGWLVFPIAIGHDPNDQSGEDFSRWSDQGLGVIAVLANGYLPEGTLPQSQYYEDFAKRCANFVANSPGANTWVIGNEMNFAVERPGVQINWSSGYDIEDEGEVITPQLYATAYHMCRQAIHSVPGHENDQVLIGAVAPWNNDTRYEGNPNGDWVQYFADILKLLGPGNTDGFTLHTYTHGSDPALIESDMKLSFGNYHYHFRAYQDFMNAVPADMRHLPVYITQTDQDVEWQDANTGWVQRAYGEIANWNSQPGNQKIRALVLYRWPKLDRWYIEGKKGVIEDFRSALSQGYRWAPEADIRLDQPFRGSFPLTQEFGSEEQFWSHYSLKGHPGLDFGLPEGTPVLATDNGTVVEAVTDGRSNWGRYVTLKHVWGESLYAQMQDIGVVVGQEVKRGDVVGRSGNTGSSSGPHLHFGIRIAPFDPQDGWGGFSDPLPYLIYTPVKS